MTTRVWTDVDFFGQLTTNSEKVNGNIAGVTAPLLSLFDKLTPVMKDIEEKFCNASDDQKKATSCLPVWGDVYHLGDIIDFHHAPHINKSFSRLLDKKVASSRFVSVSLEECSKLELCV